MKRVMLINGRRPEELRVAVVAGGVLEEYQVQLARAGLRRGNIYRGIVSNVHPSLNAAFIDFGVEKHGFLAGHDVVEQAYHRKAPEKDRRPRAEEILQKGKSILVQVTKDAVGSKGAALTTNLSLAGRYLVLTPYDGGFGISRKVSDEGARKDLRNKMKGLKLPEGCGCIARTNAARQNKRDLNRDASALLRLWRQVRNESKKGKGPRLLYSDQDLVISALRDYLDTSIEEVIVDDPKLAEKARVFMKAFMPRSKVRLTSYEDTLPLFSRYQIEDQIQAIYQRRVSLPGGGTIVIDTTEALTAIDVNSGRAKSGTTIEETALQTNLEAAEEVTRQLRLRDIGGLIIVDFIDMRASRNRNKVLKAVREAMKVDRARHQIERISPNGLMEINRQRIAKALQQQTHRRCPTCGGSGLLASPEQVGLNLIRRIQARAAKATVGGVRIRLHPELADAVQNSRRQELAGLEQQFGLQIEIIAATGLHRSEEEVEWLSPKQVERVEEPPVQTGAASFASVVSEKEQGKKDAPKREKGGEGREGAGETAGEQKKRRSGRKRSSGRRRGSRKQSGGAGGEKKSGGAGGEKKSGGAGGEKKSGGGGGEKKSGGAGGEKKSGGAGGEKKSGGGGGEKNGGGDKNGSGGQKSSEGGSSGRSKRRSSRRRGRRGGRRSKSQESKEGGGSGGSGGDAGGSAGSASKPQ